MTSLHEVYDKTVRKDTKSVIRREATQRGESQPDLSEPKRQTNQKEK